MKPLKRRTKHERLTYQDGVLAGLRLALASVGKNNLGARAGIRESLELQKDQRRDLVKLPNDMHHNDSNNAWRT